MKSEDLLYTLALQHIPNLGDTTAKKLIRHFGDAQSIFKEKKSAIQKLNGIGKIRIKELHQAAHFRAAEAELEYLEKNGISHYYFQERHYPERLKHCLDGPILLFSRGKINLEKQKILSIVGTRKITSQGAAFCESLIQDIAGLNPVIISGFAYGVDICAHKNAIEQGLQTIACLAHGLNQMYPKVHEKYVKKMEENGGFFTDFWSTDKFERNNFLKRNRIIAGLSEATIVIESAEKGGALVTADIAESYNREVFAVPGRPTDTFSMGCNKLIKSQTAHVLTSAADLAYILNWDVQEKPKNQQKQLFVELKEEEQFVFDFLKEKGKSDLDTISLNCRFPTFRTAGILLNMELKGVVRPLPGKMFEIS